VTQDFGFDALGDAEKVKFCKAEVAATLGKLDENIAQLAPLRTEVEDPDGFGSGFRRSVRMTVLGTRNSHAPEICWLRVP
jgi:hypothetical protein